LEGALRRSVGQVDGNNHCHANRHAEDKKETLQRSPLGMTPGETE
jgi:hypothetical protein